jgi:hypothetical protein
MTDRVLEFSVKTISKLAVPVRWKYVVRHSTTNCLFGGLPTTAVKIPPPDSSVFRSPWYGMKARSKPLIGNEKQPVDEPPFEVRNCMLPLSVTQAFV